MPLDEEAQMPGQSVQGPLLVMQLDLNVAAAGFGAAIAHLCHSSGRIAAQLGGRYRHHAVRAPVRDIPQIRKGQGGIFLQHPFGRHLLDPKQIWTSNVVAACMISGMIGTLYAGAALSLFAAIVVAFYWMLMCVPATVPFAMETRRRAITLALAGLIVGLIPVFGIVSATEVDSLTPFVRSMTTFNWGIIGLQVAAGILSVTPNRQ